jgi:hypothetical protein
MDHKLIIYIHTFKLKIIVEIMIYWKKNCIILIPKSNEGLKYERCILFIHV